MRIRVLKANVGDSIIISYGKENNIHILIDGGTGHECFKSLKDFMKKIQEKEQKIKLVVLTHIDNDHINGILQIMKEEGFKTQKIVENMFFNYGKLLNDQLKVSSKEIICIPNQDTKIGYKEGMELEVLLNKSEIRHNWCIKEGDTYQIEGAKMTILSPDIDTLKRFQTHWEREDEKTTKASANQEGYEAIEVLSEKRFEGKNSLANQSSIAFIFDYENYRLLLLGDATARKLEQALQKLGYSETNKLKVDCCKISHHASSNNTSNELIKMLDCNNYIISTCMTGNKRPSKECLSRIITNTEGKVVFHSNYEINFNKMFTKDEFDKYGMQFVTIEKDGFVMEELCKKQ